MKTIGELWDQIESDLEAQKCSVMTPGLLTRLATPETGQRLRVGIEWPSRARVLLFSARSNALPPKLEWPECRGLELILDTKPTGEATLIVRLRDVQGRDVFVALAEDLAKRAVGGSEPDSAQRVLSALRRWQKFLATAGRSLSDEARRGLWGELWVLEYVLAPTIGIEAAISAWRGPFGAPQDFQYQGVAVEVKTRSARSPEVVRISGERQLYESPWQHLFLAHIAVDEQDGAGESLTERISKIRNSAAATVAAELLEDALLDAGWLEVDAERHKLRGFAKREFAIFRVEGAFPRLIPPALPPGVGGVTYELSLDAARLFATPVEKVQRALRHNSTIPKL